MLLALSSTSGQVNVFVGSISGGLFSFSVVQGTTILASTVADVSGVDIPLVYSGTSGGGTPQLKIVSLNGGAPMVNLKPSTWVTTWTPQTVLATVCNGVEDRYRFGFNGQEKVNEIAGLGNHNTALFWEYDTRLGVRWNCDPKSNPSISPYASFGRNPVLMMDQLGDTIKTHSEAVAAHSTNIDKGATHTKAGEIQRYKDAIITPAYNDKNKLVGYDVYSGSSHTEMPVMQLDPGDIEEFKSNYNDTWGWAVAYESYADPIMKKIGAGIKAGNWEYAFKAIGNANKQAWNNPSFIFQMALSLAHLGTNILEGPTLNSYNGTVPGKSTGKPNSVYTYLSPSNGRAVRNYVYDKSGNCIFQVDFQAQGKGVMSGHGHQMQTPGDLGSGHGGQHVPYNQVPLRYQRLPSGVTPSTYIGQ